VQEVENPEICWNWDSVMVEGDVAVERERRFAKAIHDRSATLGRRRIALQGITEARRRRRAGRCGGPRRSCPVLGWAIEDFGLRLLHARSENFRTRAGGVRW